MLQPLRDLPLLRDTYQEGIAEARAEALLDLLTARDLPLSEDVRRRILACADVPRLSLWFKRALRASSIEEVLAD